MSARVTLAVAGRVLTQVRRDHRTLAMLLVLPCLLIDPALVDVRGPARRRLRPARPGAARALPVHRDVPGDQRDHAARAQQRHPRAAARRCRWASSTSCSATPSPSALIAAVQSALAVAVSVGLLGLDVNGPVWLLGVVAVVDAVLGTALGLFVSAFAQTEFQAVQFMPARRDPADPAVRAVRRPRRACRRCSRRSATCCRCPTPSTRCRSWSARPTRPSVWADVAVVLGFALAGLALGAATLRRRTA